MDTPIDIARDKFYTEHQGTCQTCKWKRMYRSKVGKRYFEHEYCDNENSENGGLYLEDIRECADYEEG